MKTEQEGAAYNGHFRSVFDHPIFAFNQFGDCEGAKLRSGKVHSAHNWRQVLEPILARYGRTRVRRYLRVRKTRSDASWQAKPKKSEAKR